MPLAPPDGEVCGARPAFVVACGRDEGCPDRPGIRLRSLADPAFERRFDRGRDEAGWASGEPGTLVYRPRVPLADGEYAWSAESWDGTGWIGGGPERSLRVDTVPPAEVEALEADFDPSSRRFTLRWRPVALDRAGGPEYVARYRVYELPRAGLTGPLAPYETASTETSVVVLQAPANEPPGIRFFRVTAVDRAGNESGAE